MTAANIAPWVYLLVLLWVIFCLAHGHRAGRIDLWTLITTTKNEKTYVDGKKFAYIGAFVIMAITFAYWGMIDKLTEWYAALFVGAFVVGKWLGDREQRLNSQPQAGGPK